MLFNVYPNPATEDATLAVLMDKKQKALYSISDQGGNMLVSGTVVLNKGLNTIALPVTSLPAGVYIVQFKKDMVVKQGQFVKN
jgi:hypothetical protein